MKSEQGLEVSVTIPEKLLNELEVVGGGKNPSEVILDVLRNKLSEQELKKSNGVVYTPSELAEYVASKAISYLDTRANDTLLVLDPACGDGELLSAVSFACSNIEQFPPMLYGIDIDPKSVDVAAQRLPDTFTGVSNNGLCPHSLPCDEGWDVLGKELGVNSDGFDLIIANPPWGADVSSYQALIEKSDFSLRYGQYDTSDLFIEMAYKQLKVSGVFAFIIPDSLFYQERCKLREFLVKNTEIRFIGRFGEGVFPGVNRACAVVICKKKNASKKHMVECVRISGENRKKLLSNVITFTEAEVKLSHLVPQERFLNNKDYIFNIDIDESLNQVYSKVLNMPMTCGNYLRGSRGVELSKKGNVTKCSSCGDWSPLPKKEKYACKKCNYLNVVSEENKGVIIHKYDYGVSRKLIVGEAISRYGLNNDLWIELDKKGINYKNLEVYSGNKIVVRKTGVGISATIDYGSCLTNQVVYMFKLKESVDNKTFIELFIMILNSRMAFFFVAMSNGEIEWKSHPYLTQKQILSIPAPKLEKLSEDNLTRAEKYANELREIMRSGKAIPNELDAKVERLVADIYGLGYEDYKCIFMAIAKSQELKSVKALKMIDIDDIFKKGLD
ncbi:N-6 DNA methylase [Vibrio vulnificus]|uniref:Eco57I restriction-modification methylase domain-containing protein n=1 Tax=Vibrio TaxID=662 RepID=UPI00084B6629|nr:MULTISPECIES: N-6 DNA methylase [Vibrio]EKO3509224.1 N-6 DNA methylase [Vibrio fluvialis]EHK0063143.1 N-6 DNA methylase [Vibrio parahaemolyticus]EHR6179551.1 N-6 DNA methylase [Vibrio parahaemolyticus]ELE5893964.1 N-6 DNA methylase [Vibrio fluvialis]MCA3961244.1 N-6 DNA methylase [Vibrio vulnificus]